MAPIEVAIAIPQEAMPILTHALSEEDDDNECIEDEHEDMDSPRKK